MISLKMIGLTPSTLVRANFTFCFEDYAGPVDDFVGCVCGVGSSVFVSIGIESNCDVILLVVFAPIRVEFKGDRLIELFWRPKS